MANERENIIFGFIDRELLNQDISFLINDNKIDFAKEQIIRTQAIHKDRSQFPVELSISSLKDSKHFVVVVTKI